MCGCYSGVAIMKTGKKIVTNVKIKALIHALSDRIELINIAGWLALVADSIWITRDTIVNGPTIMLSIIAVILYLGTALMTFAAYNYHRDLIKKSLHTMLETKSRYAKRTRRSV